MITKDGAVKVLVAAVLTLTLSGCASSTATKRYFWPPPPEQPRIEWLGTYQGGNDIKPPSALGTLLANELPVMLSSPAAIATDDAGKVYVVDQKANVILFDFEKKEVKKFAEDEALPSKPTGVAVDGEGNVYVADNGTNGFYVFDRLGSSVRQVSLRPAGVTGTLGQIAFDRKRNRLVVPDIKGHRFLIVDPLGKVIKAVGKRGAGDAEFNYPNAAGLDRDGNILIVDQMNARIQRFTPEGEFINSFGNRGDGPGELAVAKGVAVDSEGHIYVTDGKSNKVGIFDEKGTFLLDFGSSYSFNGTRVVPGGFLLPMGIATDRQDRIYVVDNMNARFQVFQYCSENYLKTHPFTEQDLAVEQAPRKQEKKEPK